MHGLNDSGRIRRRVDQYHLSRAHAQRFGGILLFCPIDIERVSTRRPTTSGRCLIEYCDDRIGCKDPRACEKRCRGKGNLDERQTLIWSSRVIGDRRNCVLGDKGKFEAIESVSTSHFNDLFRIRGIERAVPVYVGVGDAGASGVRVFGQRRISEGNRSSSAKNQEGVEARQFQYSPPYTR